jgi:competence protein ComGC
MLVLVVITILVVVLIVVLYILFRRYQTQRGALQQKMIEKRLKNYNLDKPPFEKAFSKLNNDEE